MATKFKSIFEALQAPFAPNQIKRKPAGGGGKMLDYITARSVEIRLDEVLGPENWRCAYRPTSTGMICRIEIRLPGESDWLAREDGGGEEAMVGAGGKPDVDNSVKSGFSNAFRRAGAKFGIGRYLYKDGVAVLLDEDDDEATIPISAGVAPQAAPVSPQSNGNGYQQPAANGYASNGQSNGYQNGAAPQNGNGGGYQNGAAQASAPTSPSGVDYGDLPRGERGIWPWCCSLAERGIVADKKEVLGFFDEFGKRHNQPRSYSEWHSQAAVDAGREAVAWLESRRNGGDSPAPAPTIGLVANDQSPAVQYGNGPIPGAELVGIPADGKQLYQLAKEAEKATNNLVSFVQPLNEFAKARGVAGKMVEWPKPAVTAVYRDLLAMIARERIAGTIMGGREIRLGGHAAAPAYDAVRTRAKIRGTVAERLHFRDGVMPTDGDIDDHIDMTIADEFNGRTSADIVGDRQFAEALLRSVKNELEVVRGVTGHAPAN